MKAIPRSVAFAVAGSIPWMAACAVGAGDEAHLPGLLDAGNAAASDAATDGDGAAMGSDGPMGSDGAQTGGDVSVEDRTSAPPPTDAGSESGPKREGGAVAEGTVASMGDATVDSSAPPQTCAVAGLRLANWSPEAPAIDFCLAPHDGTGPFRGPMMAMAAAAGDGGVGQLTFPRATAYFPVPPGAYDVRLVIGGADCSLKDLLVPDLVLPGLAACTNTTVAFVGHVQGGSADSGLGPALLTFSDDVVGPPATMPTSLDAGPPMDQFALRFVHAAPGVKAVSVVVGPADGKTLFNVGFGDTNKAKDGGKGTDPNGYSVLRAWAAKPVHVWEGTAVDGGTAPTDLFPAPSVTTAGGSVLTLVLIGTPLPGVQQLLECVDDAATTDAYSRCSTVTISTCGNGRQDPFEECDCSSSVSSTGVTLPSADPHCAADPVHGNGVLPQACSTTCRLN